MKTFLLFLVMAIASCTLSSIEEYTTATVIVKNYEAEEFTFTVQVPQTPEDFMKGLMFRESLDDDKGMLFAYADSSERSFWMKNTLIPLDILFIDEDLIIRKLHKALPCEKDPCPLYKSGVPVKYVLEVRGNLTGELGIKEGDSMVIRNLFKS